MDDIISHRTGNLHTPASTAWSVYDWRQIIQLTSRHVAFFFPRRRCVFFDGDCDTADLQNYPRWYIWTSDIVGSSEKGRKAPPLKKSCIRHWQSVHCVGSNFVTSPSRLIAPASIFFLHQETNLSFPDLGLLKNILRVFTRTTRYTDFGTDTR